MICTKPPVFSLYIASAKSALLVFGKKKLFKKNHDCVLARLSLSEDRKVKSVTLVNEVQVK